MVCCAQCVARYMSTMGVLSEAACNSFPATSIQSTHQVSRMKAQAWQHHVEQNLIHLNELCLRFQSVNAWSWG